ncbi:hypothetical protein QJS66_15600 [Kocuria rhizophila]|nr:hypothetical protein QJS66_15600 [Kocuria rhizophila]
MDLPGYERSPPVRDGGSSGGRLGRTWPATCCACSRCCAAAACRSHLSWPLRPALLRAVVANYEEKERPGHLGDARRAPVLRALARDDVGRRAGGCGRGAHPPACPVTWRPGRSTATSSHKIWTSGYDPGGWFSTVLGSADVDASLLQLPMVGLVGLRRRARARHRGAASARSWRTARGCCTATATSAAPDLDDVEHSTSSIGQTAPQARRRRRLCHAAAGRAARAVRARPGGSGGSRTWHSAPPTGLGLLPSTYSPPTTTPRATSAGGGAPAPDPRAGHPAGGDRPGRLLTRPAHDAAGGRARVRCSGAGRVGGGRAASS